MSSCERRVSRACAACLVAILLGGGGARAGEFDASVAPEGRFLLKLYPKIYYTSAYFSDRGKARNLTDVTGLLHAEIPLQIQYGVTGALSIGAMVPLGWTYREVEPEAGVTHTLNVREIWLTVQHRWLPLAFISSSSLRVKIPLAGKKGFEDGLRIGDEQVDLYPVYYFDYFSRTYFWFSELAIGYRYRFRSDVGKPFDELAARLQLGYELVPESRMRFFVFADLTQFLNGDFGGGERPFFQHEGSLHAYGYGMSMWPRPSMRLEIATSGDWSGRNQYRGMRWLVGLTKIL